MARMFRGRISRRELLLQNKSAIDFLASAADKKHEFGVPIPPAPRAREVRRPVDGKPAAPLEKHVLADVLQALRNDPRVWIVNRQQSGLFQDGDRYIRVGQKGVLDISGMLHGGRYFEIECKRPGEKPDERQALRIAHVQKGGGISGYVTSALEALALLP